MGNKSIQYKHLQLEWFTLAVTEVYAFVRTKSVQEVLLKLKKSQIWFAHLNST